MKIAYLRYCFINYEIYSLLQKQHTKTARIQGTISKSAPLISSRLLGTIYQPPTCRAHFLLFQGTISKSAPLIASRIQGTNSQPITRRAAHPSYGHTCRTFFLLFQGTFSQPIPSAASRIHGTYVKQLTRRAPVVRAKRTGATVVFA